MFTKIQAKAIAIARVQRKSWAEAANTHWFSSQQTAGRALAAEHEKSRAVAQAVEAAFIALFRDDSDFDAAAFRAACKRDE
jgi:transposase